jgi:hypothetical protein
MRAWPPVSRRCHPVGGHQELAPKRHFGHIPRRVLLDQRKRCLKLFRHKKNVTSWPGAGVIAQSRNRPYDRCVTSRDHGLHALNHNLPSRRRHPYTPAVAFFYDIFWVFCSSRFSKMPPIPSSRPSSTACCFAPFFFCTILSQELCWCASHVTHSAAEFLAPTSWSPLQRSSMFPSRSSCAIPNLTTKFSYFTNYLHLGTAVVS